MKEWVIKSEEDALNLLEQLNAGLTFNDIPIITFEHWPVLVIRISGKAYNGTVPTRIMPNILELQRQVNRIYCLTRYNTENVKKLTKEDREQLELSVKVDKGSSIFETLISDPLFKIYQDAIKQMTPEQLVTVLLSFGLMTTAAFAWKMWLNKKSKDKALDVELDKTVKLSTLDTKNIEIITDAMNKAYGDSQAALVQILENSENLKNDLLTKLKPEDNLELPTTSKEIPALKVSGKQADKITSKPRETTKEEVINGNYTIVSVDFRDLNNLHLELEDTGGNLLKVTVPEGAISYEKREILKNNGWSRKPIYMQILARILRGQITKASLISINDQLLSDEK